MRTQISRTAHAAAYPWPDEAAVAKPVPARDHGGIIEYDHISAVPLPWVIESNSEAAWLEWDRAVRQGAFAIGVTA